MADDMIDIEVIIDEQYTDPLVNIYAGSRTGLVEDIVYAVENVSRSGYTPIAVSYEGKVKLISQRDIYRVRTENRRTILDTADTSYTVKESLAKIESVLDEERFFRISQSEIVNLYKVDNFDFSLSGTVGVNFDNESTSWVARRLVKPLKEKLNMISKGGYYEHVEQVH